MMFKKTIVSAMLLALAGAQITRASMIDTLFDWGFNINGVSTVTRVGGEPASIPNLDVSGFSQTTGLGTLTLRVDPGTAGDYFAASFIDIDIDERENTYFNEQGSVSGVNPANLTWEVDEPGYVFGDIYDNLINYSPTTGFDNSIFGGNNNLPDDVAVGLGWNFTLADGQYAVINYNISETDPASGFYVSQIDPDSHAQIYFTTDLKIEGGSAPGPQPVPEPATAGLLALGCAMIGILSVKRKK